MAAGIDHTVAVERTLTFTCTEQHRIDRSPSSYRRYRYVHARRPRHRIVVEVAVVSLAKIAFLMLLGWLLFAPHPHSAVAAGTTQSQPTPTLPAPAAKIAPPAPTSKN